MAGIYIHVPFCKTRCIYCDFYSNTGNRHSDFLTALHTEMQLRQNYLQQQPIQTIYFGGGTPSQLSIKELQQIFECIYKYFVVQDGAEVTLEANPDDLNKAYIDGLKSLPINRLSVGVQTFDDQTLKFLKRRHSGKQAREAIHRCQSAGFQNISIDLIYGLPSRTVTNFEIDLKHFLSLDVPHISAYHLIYEQGTQLFKLREKGAVQMIDDEQSIEQFSLLRNMLQNTGYEQYEISNFARNEQYSRHNTAYWQGKHYLGLGPSAHSFDGHSRQWNIASLHKYAEALKNKKLDAEIEVQTIDIRYNELVLTGLRTKWGIDLQDLAHKFGNERKQFCLKNAQPHLANGTLVLENDTLTLSKQGFFVSDGIMSDLMWI